MYNKAILRRGTNLVLYGLHGIKEKEKEKERERERGQKKEKKRETKYLLEIRNYVYYVYWKRENRERSERSFHRRCQLPSLRNL